MSAKIKVLGVCLGLVANALHLHSMYIIKVSPIQAGDTLILRFVGDLYYILLT